MITSPLHELLRSRLHEPFGWGARDCACLAFDVAQAMTGRDAAAPIRGRWRDARSAARLLRRLGGWAGLAARCGWQPLPVAQARDGDVLQLAAAACRGGLAGEGALAVCAGGRAVAQGPAGLVWLPLACAVGAWRVG
jgi:hypothetical protein